MKLLLWDIDGTILLTPGAGARAMQRVGRGMFGKRFAFDGVDVAGRLDGDLFDELATRAGVDDPAACHEAFRSAYLVELEAELLRSRDSIREMPGVRAIVRTLTGDARVVQGLMSGNYGAAAELKLRAIRFDTSPFALHAYGDEAPDRSALVRLAIERFGEATGNGVDTHDVIVIGDTPRDVACARANGCVSFAVATGHHSVDALRACGADHVVGDLVDATPLLSLLG